MLLNQPHNKVGALDTNTFKPGTAMNAVCTIEISISCRNLANKDVLSKSDPVCIVYHRPLNQKKWVELMRTEQLDNNLNPDFAKKLTMEYRFEQSQSLRFEVVDIDSDGGIEEQDEIGFIECTVANIVSSGARGYSQELESTEVGNTGGNGTIILTAEELESNKDEIFLKFNGSSVGSCTTCFIVKSFFVISRINDAGTFLIVHRCEDTRGFSPQWPSFLIAGRSLCNGDHDRRLKIEVYRKTFKQEDELIGYCFSTLSRLSNRMDDRLQITGVNGKVLKTAINLVSCIVTPVYTFVEYVQAGTKIHLCFAIDFTSSNGDPTQVQSLHHISHDPNTTNPYEQAIAAAGEIVKDYDNTNVFPVFGFGARIPPKGETSHCFPVNLSAHPACKGIEGVLRAYRQCVSRVQLFGPTNFSPIINRVASIAEKAKPGQHYYLLVIVTDGVITDMAQTKEAIVRASVLPISIIIVGVGDADFTSMEELDGDDGMVSSGGRYAERDIVQFVEYRSADSWMRRTGEYTANKEAAAKPPPAALGGGLMDVVTVVKQEHTNLMAQGQLAEEILSEVPMQVTSYMKARGIEPSMVVKEESAPEEVFKGADKPFVTEPAVAELPEEPEPEPETKKVKKLTEKEKEKEKEKKKKEKEKEEKAAAAATAAAAAQPTDKQVNTWNVLAIVNKGKKKFRDKSPRHRAKEVDKDKLPTEDAQEL